MDYPLDRRDFLKMAGAGAAGALLAGVAGRAALADEKSKPNIVFLLADDLGYECLGSYGGTSYKTPHLDALAKEGTRFEYCYATPLCSPSRAEAMTGRYGFRTGWTHLIDKDDEGEFFDPKKEKTFGHVLKEAGYATACAGKWQLCQFDQHPDHLKECGFDESCMWTWVDKGKKKTSRYWDPSIWQNGKRLENTKGKYGPDLYSDFLCDFITRHKDKPFFVYYPMALVHDPLTHTPDSEKKGAKENKGDQGVFTGMVAYMDKDVGKITAHLEKLGLRNNTLILFSGDNGTESKITSMLGDKEVKGGKHSMGDTGSHVPLIANWPGTVPAGKVSSDLVDFSDLLPTFAGLAGAALPKEVTLDGRSFAPQLRGEKGNPRECVFVQLGSNKFVRDQRWKLNNKDDLFDTKADPDEKSPLKPEKDDAEAAAARKRLKERLSALK